MKKTLSRAIARSTALMLSFMLMFGTVRTPVFAAQDEAADAQVELFLDENAGDSFTDEGAAEQAAGQQIDIIDENGEIVGDADQPVEDAFDEAGAQAEAEAEAPAEVPAEEEVEAGLDVASQEEPPAEVPAEEEAEAGQDRASQEEAAASSQEEAPAQVPAEEEAEAGQDVASQEEEAAAVQEEEEAADRQKAEQDSSDGDTALPADPGSGEAGQEDQDAAVQPDQNEETQGDGTEDSNAGYDSTKEEQPENAASAEEVIEDVEEEEAVSEQAQDGALTSNGGTITLAVGDSRNVYLSIPSKEALLRALWSSNSGNLSINSYGGKSTMCTIKAVSYTSSPLIVDCTYYTQYLDSMNYMRTKTNYASFYVYITQGSSGTGTTGSFSISSSATTVNIDRSKCTYTSLELTCGTNLSDTVYIRENSSSGRYVSASLNRVEGNKAYYIIDSHEVGSQYIKFELIYKKDAYNTIIKDSVTVRVNVTCSHYYDNGVVTKEPTSTSSGTKVYTCRNCNHQKTETIPATGNSISTCDISLSATSYTYTGSAHKPSVTVKLGSKTLSSGTDYTVSYTNNTNAGTAKVTVTGKGNYSGSASKNFTIQKAAQSLNATVSATSLKKGATTQITTSGIGTITYTSSDTSVAAVSSTGLITANAAGKASITVTAAGNANYNSAKKTISITVTETKPAAVTTPVSISFSDTSVTLDKGSSRVITVTTYGGLPSTFKFSSKRSDTSVISTAWTGSWKKSNGKHSHDLTITGLADGKSVLTVYVKDSNTGNYWANNSINITVKSPASASNKITDSGVTLSKTSYTYNGKAKKPGVTVKAGGKTLKKDTDYKLSYSSNIKAGTAVVTVTGKGKYTGKVQKTFTINKASQNFNLIRSSYTYKKSDLKKSKQRVPIIVFNYKGTLSKRSSSKYIYFSNGACYVKKGTPKGTYKVIVSASGNKNYKMQEKTVKITIK